MSYIVHLSSLPEGTKQECRGVKPGTKVQGNILKISKNVIGVIANVMHGVTAIFRNRIPSKKCNEHLLNIDGIAYLGVFSSHYNGNIVRQWKHD